MAKKPNPKNKAVKKQYNMPSLFVNAYLFIMFTLFPLILTNQYAFARRDKYYTFLAVTGILLVLFILYFVTMYMNKNQAASANQEQLAGKKAISKLSVLDIFILAFFAVNLLSTLFSGDIATALNGSAGRNNGLLLITAYTVAYFIISRFYYFKEMVLIAFVVVGSLVCGLGILNFFFQDPFGLYNNYTERYIYDFISTIGNKNMFSSFTCLFLPVCVGLFLTSKNTPLRVFYLVGTAFGFLGLLVADSDSGYIGFGLFMIAALLYCVRKFSRLRDFCMIVATILLSGKILRLIALLFGDKSKGLDYFGELFVYNNISLILLILFVAIIAVFFYLEKRNPDLSDKQFPKHLFYIVLGIIVLGFAAVAGAIIYYTFIDTTSEISGVKAFLRFDESWGTHRGYMWIKCFELFQNFNVKDMLIGPGPDSLKTVFDPVYGKEMIAKYGETTNSAHNEYLNYLVTLGILGLVSYLGIIGTSITRMTKKIKENSNVLLFLFAVISYSGQAIVNISQPITTPFLFLFIAIGENITRTNSMDSSEKRY